MTDTARPTGLNVSGNELQLTGPHWTFILQLYGRQDVQQTCLVLQDSFGVDVSCLLTLLWCAKNGFFLDKGDVEVLDRVIASWRDQVVGPLRQIRRELRQSGSGDAGVGRFRDKIKSAEIDAEQIEIALLVQAVRSHERADRSADEVPREAIARIVAIAIAYYAARAAIPAARLKAPEAEAAMKVLADATADAHG